MNNRERKDYNRFMKEPTNGLDETHCVHYCPSCGEYLFAGKNHMSYNFCIYCGKNLKGVKLPYERI